MTDCTAPAGCKKKVPFKQFVSLYHASRGTVRQHQGVRARERLFGPVRFCRHEARHVQRLLARGRARAYGQGHGKHIQEMAAACGERGVPSLQCRRHVTEGLHKMLSCFIERDCNDTENMQKNINIARMLDPPPGHVVER